MAGNYPDAPGPRMAWDADGSVLVRNAAGVPTVLTLANAQALNDEADTADVSGAANTINWYTVIFPELRDIAGYFFSWGGGANSFVTFAGMGWSPDTTSGLDGTWNTVAGAVSATPVATSTPPTKPTYRTSIQTKALPGCKAVRLGVQDNNAFGPFARALHLYGAPSAAAGNRLELWHPTLTQRLGPADLDWGNAAQGSTAIRQFRVKNASASQTANTITVSLDALTDSSPTQVSQHSLSSDGSTFTGTLSLGNLAPGAISSILHLKRTQSATAALGLWSLRLKAVPVSWT